MLPRYFAGLAQLWQEISACAIFFASPLDCAFLSYLSCTEGPVFHYICSTSSWEKIFCFLFLNCQCCLHQAECTGTLRSYLCYKTHTSEIIMLLNSNSSKSFSFYFSAAPLTLNPGFGNPYTATDSLVSWPILGRSQHKFYKYSILRSTPQCRKSCYRTQGRSVVYKGLRENLATALHWFKCPP